MSSTPRSPGPEAPRESPRTEPAERMPADERLAALRRIEQRLEEIRGLLGADAREQQYRTFSLPQMIGSVLQALVVGVLFAALSDWIFEAPLGSQLVKLAFAGVLQLGALTALVSDRKRP